MRLEEVGKRYFPHRKSLRSLNELLGLREVESDGACAPWRAKPGSARARYSAFGAITKLSHIGWRLLKSPMMRTLKRNSGMLSDSIWIRPSELWCSVATRRVSAKHWSVHNARFL